MQKLLDSLQGYKTYIVAIVTAVYQLLVATGTISAKHQTQITVILGAGLAGAFRSALSKLQAVK